MKAIVYYKYGSPDVLELKEIDKPAVEDDEMLVRVHAASLNPLDWHFMRGLPYIVRIAGNGLLKPKNRVLGVDVAGYVEAVGKNVRQFRTGDEVFGWCRGAFAEYVCGRENVFVAKPSNLTFEQAAAVPIAAFTALQGLRDRGEIKPGQKVLIIGASGGVGTFAVQIAKVFGAEVTGVCSTRNVEMVRSIGADQVIDYTQEDFTQSELLYDLILDTVGNRSLSNCRRILSPNGILVLVGGPTGRWFGGLTRFIKALALSPFVRQRMRPFIATSKKEDLVFLRELIEAGKVMPVIDCIYELGEIPDAICYLEEGHARGKIVITVYRDVDRLGSTGP